MAPLYLLIGPRISVLKLGSRKLVAIAAKLVKEGHEVDTIMYSRTCDTY